MITVAFVHSNQKFIILSGEASQTYPIPRKDEFVSLKSVGEIITGRVIDVRYYFNVDKCLVEITVHLH